MKRSLDETGKEVKLKIGSAKKTPSRHLAAGEFFKKLFGNHYTIIKKIVIRFQAFLSALIFKIPYHLFSDVSGKMKSAGFSSA